MAGCWRPHGTHGSLSGLLCLLSPWSSPFLPKVLPPAPLSPVIGLLVEGKGGTSFPVLPAAQPHLPLASVAGSSLTQLGSQCHPCIRLTLLTTWEVKGGSVSYGPLFKFPSICGIQSQFVSMLGIGFFLSVVINFMRLYNLFKPIV